jgi:hypothetical protein
VRVIIGYRSRMGVGTLGRPSTVMRTDRNVQNHGQERDAAVKAAGAGMAVGSGGSD